MTSPYASGGGGTHFEATVVSYYLAALLCGLSARGLLGTRVTAVRTQRGTLGAPLDDIIIAGAFDDGTATALHLQIKNSIAFTSSDANWIDVLQRAWDTFTTTDFDCTNMRFGVGIGRYSARADDQYQSVLLWARYSESADDFFLRIERRDFSSEAKIAFLQSIRDVLSTHIGRPVTNEELWEFLKCLLVIHFDFQNSEVSRDGEAACDRLRMLFVDDAGSRSRQLWDHLIAQAGRVVPVAGSADLGSLRQRMRADGFVMSEPSFSRRQSLLAINQESQRALAEIKEDIAGLRLHRRAAGSAMREALQTSRFIQLIGEPGTGKSALLKEFAEECARVGPIFVLKDARIQPRGWAAHASVLGIGTDCVEVLTDLAGAGEPVLFIDGIDKIVDPQVQVTVNDVLRAIATTPHLSDWKVVVTVREQNLRHLETWIDGAILKNLPLASVTVSALGSDERDTVTAYFPQLRPLLSQNAIDVILHRPFFLNALLTLGPRGQADSQLPATEVALLELWWRFGGTDALGFASAQEQREALIALGERLTQSPGTPINLGGLPSDAIGALVNAGVLRHLEMGHSVAFTHDIFEEWALCETLIRHKADVPAFLRNNGEPQHLIRPVQLYGTYVLETEPTPEAWQALIEEVAAPDLRPVWQRAVLLSCLQSTRTTALLVHLTSYLLADEAHALRKLMLALRTIEVVPNTRFLNEAETPHIEPADRAKYANIAAKPRVTIWVRFLDWLLPHVRSLPAPTMPDLLPIFIGWQNLFAGRGIRHCREIGQIAGEWLEELERDLHPDNVAERRPPRGIRSLSYSEEQELEASVRAIFLESAAENPERVSAYLAEKAQTERRHRIYREAIMKSATPLARHLPTALVDFMLSAFLDHPDDIGDDPFFSDARHLIDDIGVQSDQIFNPPSIIQPPFLLLLRLHENEGLRLIRELCNHSIAAWRWSRTHPAHYAPATPLPATVTLEAVPREFWGDYQVYQWYRGIWGNDAVCSGLMALEWWALQQLDAGADFSEVYDKVVDGHNSAAILGVAVSLCLAFPEASLARSAALVTCAHLWVWDIARWVADRLPASQLGDWRRHRHELESNKQSNKRQHRKHDIRDLLIYLIFGSGESQQARVLASVAAFPQHLPFEYEEERGNPRKVAELTERMNTFAERGNLENWRAQEKDEGDGILVWCDPPSVHTEEFKAQSEDQAQQSEYFSLGLWANDALENGALDSKISFPSAWERARAIDDERAFDPTFDSYHEQRAAAIAGVAFVFSRYYDNEDAIAWAMKVLDRALTSPEPPRNYLVRNAVLGMNAKVFAVHGYSELLARNRHISEAYDALLWAALHPLENLAGAVYVAMKSYAPKHRAFCWVLVDLALGRCIVDYDAIPDYHNVVPDARELALNEKLFRRAKRALANGAIPESPQIPMPWVKRSRLSWAGLKEQGIKAIRRPRPRPDFRSQTCYDGYRRNPRAFLWHVARALALKAPLAELVAAPGGPERAAELAAQLRDFTIMEVLPPFANSRRESPGNTPFEWVFACSAWLGKALAAIPDGNAKSRLVEPVLAVRNDTALLVLHTTMFHFMLHALARPSEIADANLALWERLTDWLLSNSEGAHPLDEHLDNHYVDCIFSLLFCATGDFSPLHCLVEPGWQHLHLFRRSIEKVVVHLGANSYVFRALVTFLSRGGRDWLPEPGLGWIEAIAETRKSDVPFWEAHGENTVALLKSIVTDSQSVMTDALRQRIIRLADKLVDVGVRGAGFLQQELVRRSPR